MNTAGHKAGEEYQKQRAETAERQRDEALTRIQVGQAQLDRANALAESATHKIELLESSLPEIEAETVERCARWLMSRGETEAAKEIRALAKAPEQNAATVPLTHEEENEVDAVVDAPYQTQLWREMK